MVLRRLQVCSVFVASLSAASVLPAQSFYPILNNGGFETGRGPSGEVDLAGGSYSSGFRSGVYDFVPGGPGDSGPYGYQDWWWGDDAFYTGFPDPVGFGAAATPVDWSNTITPRTGTRMIRFKGTGARNGNGSDVYQDIDVSSYSTDIDSTTTTLHFGAWWNKVDEDSAAVGEIAAYFYDAAKVQLPTAGYVAFTPDLDQATWQQSSGSVNVPAGTRYVRFRIVARGQSHYFVDSQSNSHWNTPYFGTYADDVTAVLEVPLPPAVSVAVVNHSFEAPPLAGPGTDAAATPSGWTSSTSNRRHLWDDGTRLTDPIPDGNQVVSLRGNTRLQQTLSEPMTAGNAYVVEVANGQRLDETAPTTFEVLLTGGTGAGTQRLALSHAGWDFDTATLATPGAFSEARAIYTVLAGDPNIGQSLGLMLRNTTTGTGTTFDNVRVTRHATGTMLDLPIVNPSFEADVLADGTSTTMVASGWTATGAAANRLLSNPAVPLNYPALGAPDGENTITLNGAAGFHQRLTGQALQPNTAYVLSFSLGNRSDVASDPHIRVDVVAGNGPNITSSGMVTYKRWFSNAASGLAIPGTPVGAGDYRRIAFTFETDATPPSGDIWIRFRGNGGSSNFADVDDIALQSYPAP